MCGCGRGSLGLRTNPLGASRREVGQNTTAAPESQAGGTRAAIVALREGLLHRCDGAGRFDGPESAVSSTPCVAARRARQSCKSGCYEL